MGLGMQWHQLDHMQTICTSLQTDNHTNTSSLNFYRPDALPDAQPKHWRQNIYSEEYYTIFLVICTENTHAVGHWDVAVKFSLTVFYNVALSPITKSHLLWSCCVLRAGSFSFRKCFRDNASIPLDYDLQEPNRKFVHRDFSKIAEQTWYWHDIITSLHCCAKPYPTNHLLDFGSLERVD